MFSSINQILPSLAALGMFAYWGIGVAAGLEAFVFSGIFLPGTLIVDAGGFMVQRGLLDFFDLAWFVAIGSILGGEATFWAGRHLRRGMAGRWSIEQMAPYGRAQRLFERHGGFALVLGRFFGPVAAFVPFAAAIAEMEPRRFRLWNAISGVPYALAHVGFGYALGAGLTRLSPVLTRQALFLLGLALVALLLLWLLRRLDRALPALLALLGGGLDRLALHPRAGSFGARHPRLGGFIAARLDRSHFFGLPASLLALAFGYLLVLLIVLAFDFVQAEPIVQVDARLAQLMHLFRTPGLVRAFTTITALGDVRFVVALLGLAGLWLVLTRRLALLAGLLTALGADLAAVTVSKLAFGRPRSTLGYFAESTGSFPSGHAALGVAFFGMLFYLLWRSGRLGPMTAAFWGAMTAFLIGLSRLYLVEHYLSDVLAGWLLGGLCLLSGIAVAEWRLALRMPKPRAVTGGRAALALFASLALVGYAGLRLSAYTKALNTPPTQSTPITLANTADLFTSQSLPTKADTLLGEQSFALNIAFAAQSPERLVTALQAQGWVLAQPASVGALVQTALGDLRDSALPDAAMAPLFWNNGANDIGLSQLSAPEPKDTPRLRLWASGFNAPDGRRLWLGVASRDDGLGLEQAQTAPDIATALASALGAKEHIVAPTQPPLPLITLE